MSKHTQGRWIIPAVSDFYTVYENGFKAFRGVSVMDQNNRSICAFPSSSKRDDLEREANIKLVAAAPDLLAALEQIARLSAEGEVGEKVQYALGEIARKAIDKAKGE